VLAKRSPALVVALSALRRRPVRAALTAAGIVLGVGMVVAVLSLSATLLDGFEDLYDVVYGKTDLIVSRDVGGAQTPFDESALEEVLAVPGVDREATTGQVGGVGWVVDERGEVGEGAESQLALGGFRPDALDDVSRYEVVAGRTLSRPGDFAVEEGWARKLGIGVGDELRLALPVGVRARTITGVFRFDRPVGFGGIGFAAEPLADAQRDLDLEGRLTQVNVRAADRGEVEELQDRLRDALPGDLSVRTRSEQVDELSAQLSGVNTFLLFFAGVAVFVGAFLIFNAFNVAVVQRRREIGMLRTIGATRAGIARQVLAEAAILGAVGSALGLAVGVGLALGLIALVSSAITGIPFGDLVVPASAIVAGLLIGTLVTALAALWPALRAGRVAPVEAMTQRAERSQRVPWRAALAGLAVLAASAPGIWLLARGDASGIARAYGVTGVIGVFLGVALASPLAMRPLVRALARPLAIGRPVEGRMAADAAARAPTRTALTASAVMIGLALVVTFGAFSSSAISAVRDTIGRSLAADVIVSPRDLLSFQGFSPELAREISALPEVEVASPLAFALLRVDGEATQVLGVDPETHGRVSGDRLVDGEAPDWTALAGPSAIVSSTLADARGLAVGDVLEIGTAAGAPERVRVAAVIDLIDEHVYVSRERLARAGGTTQVYQVYANARDGQEAAMRAAIERVLEGYPSAEAASNEELLDEIEGQFDQIFGFFYALLGVAIVASAFGVANTIAMSVIERTREIGLIRAVGGTRAQVRAMIRREGVLVSVIGLLLGLAVGLVLAAAFIRAASASFSGLEFVVPWTVIGIVAAGAVVLGVVAAALPARRAARMDVVQAVGME
jgi:putative ABC transport system permease protein